MPYSESDSPAKRPSMAERQSSGQSAATTKPSPSNRQPKQHRVAHPVGGHGRLGQKNLSFGKNLNKLAKLTGDEATASSSARPHKTKSQTPSTSPAAAAHSHGHVKRNSSTVSLPRVGSKASIRKNHSNVSLKRNGSSSTQVNKTGRPTTPLRRSQSQGSELDHIEDKPTGGFIMDDGGEDSEGAQEDDEWTEESNSQSPSTTRRSSTSRGNRSSGKATPAEEYPTTNTKEPDRSTRPPDSPPESPESNGSRNDVTGTRQDSDLKVTKTRAPTALPDASAITSRLLGRNRSHISPQVDSVSAMGTPGTQTPPTAAGSQSFNIEGSSMPENGISRFLNAPSSSGGSNSYHLYEALSNISGAMTTSATPPNHPSQSQSRSSPPRRDEDDIRRVQSVGNLNPRAPIITRDATVGNEPPSVTFEPANKQDRRKKYTDSKMEIWKATESVRPSVGPPTPVARLVPFNMLSADEQRVRQYKDARRQLAFINRLHDPLRDAIKRVIKPPTREERERERRQENHERGAAAAKAAAKESLSARSSQDGNSKGGSTAAGTAAANKKDRSGKEGGTRGGSSSTATKNANNKAAINQRVEVSTVLAERPKRAIEHLRDATGTPAGVRTGDEGGGGYNDNIRPISRSGRTRSVHFAEGAAPEDEGEAAGNHTTASTSSSAVEHHGDDHRAVDSEEPRAHGHHGPAMGSEPSPAAEDEQAALWKWRIAMMMSMWNGGEDSGS